jgi:DNA-directed RNA polymerase subunit RPC12/RpoP
MSISTNSKNQPPKQRCLPCNRDFRHVKTNKYRHLYECLKCGSRLSVPINQCIVQASYPTNPVY